MKAIDTNIVLRLIIDDDPAQAALAARTVRDAVFIPITVLLEVAWVLGSVYEQDRTHCAEALLRLLDVPTVMVEDEATVRWALERYRDHGADIADMLHLVAARSAAAFVTFDRKLTAQAGSDSPTVVKVLSA
jgi:predicted nucleic-acid-binding protein